VDRWSDRRKIAAVKNVQNKLNNIEKQVKGDTVTVVKPTITWYEKAQLDRLGKPGPVRPGVLTNTQNIRTAKEITANAERRSHIANAARRMVSKDNFAKDNFAVTNTAIRPEFAEEIARAKAGLMRGKANKEASSRA